ncbi:MAG TPA: hypothetical protein VHE55_17065 [Fimbriimonadaceae bacterium]|nr:hypothetical protein [Fimbriimonadaceae bacterium]
MESLKIVAMCVVASILYGIIHDIATANFCVEYFSVFHPDIFHTKSPWLLALGWGIVATWWMGLFFGILVAASATVGRLPKFRWIDLIVPLLMVLLFSYICALVSGVTAYYFVVHIPDWAMTPHVAAAHLNPDTQRAFTADLYAHNASYLASAFGAIVLCFWIIFRRWKVSRFYLVSQPPYLP